jgi:hypothetical protein
MVNIDGVNKQMRYWVEDGPKGAIIPAVTGEQLAEQAVASIDLPNPVLGVITPKYTNHPEWAIYEPIWWVNAPLWLWIDNPSSWTSHTATATATGLTVTVTVVPWKLLYDMGDGETVACFTPGTRRNLDLDEPMQDESPTGCQHFYQQPNTKGDPDSRYWVTPKLVWTVNWQATDHQQGTFTISSQGEPYGIHVGTIHAVIKNWDN